MLEFFKQRKMLIIVGILAIGVLGVKIYNSKSENIEINNNEILVQKDQEKEENEELIVVHITGEIKKPGVVRIKEGSRIEDVIEAAGGLTEKADITEINLAYVVEDGTKIKVPSIEDEEISKENIITENAGNNVIITDEKIQDKTNTIVNINKASQAELETLPGIGPSISSKIIEYRSQNGKFQKIEDIKKVTGIGENKYEKIKDYIKVK